MMTLSTPIVSGRGLARSRSLAFNGPSSLDRRTNEDSILKDRDQLAVTGEVGIEKSPSLEETLYNALAKAKIWTSKVGMHLNRADRDRFFRQLDLMHDAEEWFGNDKPIALDSYQAFIRFMLQAGTSSKPSLALSTNGNLIAVWHDADERIDIEFLDEKHARWLVSRTFKGETERAAGATTVARLIDVLRPYDILDWLK